MSSFFAQHPSLKHSRQNVQINDLSSYDSSPLSNSHKMKLADLYAEHQKNVLAYIVSLGIEQSAAEDLTQNVFLQICSDYVGGREIVNLKSYLFGVAKFFVFEYRRRAERFPIILFSEDFENRVIGLAAAQTRPDASIKNVSLKVLNVIVANLPNKYREAFELRYIRNLPISVAAKLSGCSQNTLCQRTSRAVKIIRNKLRFYLIKHLQQIKVY